jgi:hypothetical protein
MSDEAKASQIKVCVDQIRSLLNSNIYDVKVQIEYRLNLIENYIK